MSGAAGRLPRFVIGVSMNQRDQELLSKQLGWLSPTSRNDVVMVWAIVAAFAAGMSLGGLFMYKNDPVQIVSNDAMAAISHPNEASPSTFPNSTH